MPHTLRASSAPNGLNIQVTRVEHDGLYLRIWRASVDELIEVDSADRRDFVLVHGIGVSSQYFERLALTLAKVGMVYLVDLPGFAGVPRPSHPLEIADFGRLVGGWVEKQGLVDPVIIGHSMGAQVVTEVLAQHPGLSTHAVLIGPPVNVEERSTTLQALRFLQSTVFESSRTRRIAMSGYVRCGPRWFAQTLPRMMRYPIEERLAEVDASVLVLRGVHDRVAPEGWVDLVAGLPTKGRWEEVPGAAHAVIYDHSDEVAALVMDHLRR